MFSFLTCKVTHSQFPGLAQGYLWGDHYSAYHIAQSFLASLSHLTFTLQHQPNELFPKEHQESPWSRVTKYGPNLDTFKSEKEYHKQVSRCTLVWPDMAEWNGCVTCRGPTPNCSNLIIDFYPPTWSLKNQVDVGRFYFPQKIYALDWRWDTIWLSRLNRIFFLYSFNNT